MVADAKTVTRSPFNEVTRKKESKNNNIDEPSFVHEVATGGRRQSKSTKLHLCKPKVI